MYSEEESRMPSRGLPNTSSTRVQNMMNFIKTIAQTAVLQGLATEGVMPKRSENGSSSASLGSCSMMLAMSSERSEPQYVLMKAKMRSSADVT